MIENTNFPTKEEIQQALEMRHTKIVQDKLSKAKVAICGLGGLGSNIAIALARAGVGHLHLIDFDQVDLTNLNRQQYKIEYIGQYKTYALKEEIKEFSPYIEIDTTNQKLDENNIKEILVNETIICEAFDKADQKAMLTNYVLENMPEKYLVGASGMAGYSSSNTVVTKKIMQKYYLCGDGFSTISDKMGLMAPRVMICAAHQANMIIRIILGEETA